MRAEFVEFVLASGRRLCRVAHLICGDLHRAEDFVETALAQVYARWSRIRRDEGPERYAHRAVVNAAIDERRRPWRREHASDNLPDRAVPLHAVPADDGVTLAVLEALAGLPVRQRAVVVLRYIEDLDVEGRDGTAADVAAAVRTGRRLRRRRRVLTVVGSGALAGAVAFGAVAVGPLGSVGDRAVVVQSADGGPARDRPATPSAVAMAEPAYGRDAVSRGQPCVRLRAPHTAGRQGRPAAAAPIGPGGGPARVGLDAGHPRSSPTRGYSPASTGRLRSPARP